MAYLYIFFAAFAIFHCASMSTASHCSSDIQSFGVSVSSSRNDSGQCSYLLSARTEQNITMDVQHKITKCDGRKVIRIKASIRKVGESEKGMVFHSRVGSNVIISNNGRTIEKKYIAVGANGAAFTSRPLKNYELFEVTLNKRGNKYGQSLGIGVLTIRPEDFEFPRFAFKSPHAWMYYETHIWNDADIKRSNYGVDIDKLPAGTRFGVMKKSSGDIHFFVNGDDQGSAVSGISGPVDGIAELSDDAQKITILKL